MKHIWSPWRLEYLTAGKKPGCIFCNAVQSSDDRENLVLYRGELAFLILNRFPYNNGHLMVVPDRHVGSLDALTPDERAELMELTRRAEVALTEAYHPHGLNMGINLGKAAGAGVLDHLHVHIVPRWNGDTNYMTVVGQTRVLPEELHQTVARLRPIFARLAAP